MHPPSKSIYRSPGSTRNASRASGLMWATFSVGGVLITIVCSSTTYQTGSDTGLLSRRRMVRIPVWALSLVLAEPDPVSTTVSEKDLRRLEIHTLTVTAPFRLD